MSLLLFCCMSDKVDTQGIFAETLDVTMVTTRVNKLNSVCLSCQSCRSVTSCLAAPLWLSTWESVPTWCMCSSSFLPRTWRSCSNTRTWELGAAATFTPACPLLPGRAPRTHPTKPQDPPPKPLLEPQTLLTLHPWSNRVLRDPELPWTQQLPTPLSFHINPFCPTLQTHPPLFLQLLLCLLVVNIPAVHNQPPHQSVHRPPPTLFLDPGAQRQLQPSKRLAWHLLLHKCMQNTMHCHGFSSMYFSNATYNEPVQNISNSVVLLVLQSNVHASSTAELNKPPGAVIESLVSPSPGVFSGTFSGKCVISGSHGNDAIRIQ